MALEIRVRGVEEMKECRAKLNIRCCDCPYCKQTLCDYPYINDKVVKVVEVISE